MGNCMPLMTCLLVLAGFVILYMCICIVKLKEDIDFYRNDGLDWRNKALFWEGQYDIMANGFDALWRMSGFDPDERFDPDESEEVADE